MTSSRPARAWVAKAGPLHVTGMRWWAPKDQGGAAASCRWRLAAVCANRVVAILQTKAHLP